MTQVAISADSNLTAAAGAQVARLGGNAADVAVACALAATVSEVLMCSLGGSGFFMVRLPGQPAELIEGADVFPRIDQAPRTGTSAWREVDIPYGDGIRIMAGHASVAVPGMLAAAEKTWQRHGSLPWSEVVAPARELASRKIPASPTLVGWLAMSAERLFAQQDASRESFLTGGQPLQLGNEFRIAKLAETFDAISEEGAATFYRGDLAATIAREMSEHGGLISRQDLEQYEAMVRRPLSIESGGFKLALNPPPAVGGAAVGFLIRAIESSWNNRLTLPEQFRLQAQAQLKLLGVRENELAIPELDEPRATELLSNASAGGRGSLESPNTTHISVVTKDGGMVSVTMSMGYGAGIVIPDLGIACNNALGEPELNPAGFHRGRPGQRICSNMAPTLAWNESDGRCLALGSPGASRITTALAQTWLHVVLDGKSYEEAVAAPRMHIESHSGEIRAQYEPGIDTSLLGRPFTPRPFDAPNWYFGGVKLAGLDQQGQLHAVADSRREGAVEFID